MEREVEGGERRREPEGRSREHGNTVLAETVLANVAVYSRWCAEGLQNHELVCDGTASDSACFASAKTVSAAPKEAAELCPP